MRFSLYINVLATLQNYYTFYQLAFKKLMRPLVEASCDVTGLSLANSGSMALASCLPSSTPHWSNELMSQMIPCVKILCSYSAANIK